jgi:hypothetical protein
MIAFRIELRRSVLAATLPLLVFVSAAAVFAKLTPGIALWPNVNAQLNISLVLVGPLVAGICAWAGGRERRRRMGYLPALAARGPAAPLLAEIGAAVTWCLIAFGITIVAVSVATALRAKGTSPSVVWAAETWLAVAMFAVIGFVAGRVIGNRLVAPGVALALYAGLAVCQVKYGQSWVTALSPVTTVTGDPLQRYNTTLGFGQLMWLGGLAGGVVAGHLLIRDVRQRGAGIPTIAAAFVAAVAVLSVGVVVVSSQNARVFAGNAQFNPVCAQRAPTVCTHPAFRSAIGSLHRSFQLLDDRLDGTRYYFDRVVQKERAGDPSLGASTISFGLDDLRQGYATSAEAEVVTETFVPLCTGTGVSAARQLQSLVIAWLQASSPSGRAPVADAAAATAGIEDARVAAATRAFLGMNEQQRRDWLRGHISAMARCALRPDDLTQRV